MFTGEDEKANAATWDPVMQCTFSTSKREFLASCRTENSTLKVMSIKSRASMPINKVNSRSDSRDSQESKDIAHKVISC